MQVPTKMVKVRDSGHVCIINETDFDPTLHAELEEVATEDKAPETELLQKTPQPAPFNLADVNIKDAAAFIAEYGDAEGLQRFWNEEAEGKGRKGVFAAIENRIKELGEE